MSEMRLTLERVMLSSSFPFTPNLQRILVVDIQQEGIIAQVLSAPFLAFIVTVYTSR